MSDSSRLVYEKSVFINCPFDAEYRHLMLAIVFTVVAHRFSPRSARETEGVADPRFLRILNTISACKYSIHDLSRCVGEGPENIARFNMPFELGMAAALRAERAGTVRTHNWMVLVPEGYAYQRFVSDLAGFDPARHSQTVESVIREVSGWLRALPDFEQAPSARQIQDRFETFDREFATLRADALEKETWEDLVVAAHRTVALF